MPFAALAFAPKLESTSRLGSALEALRGPMVTPYSLTEPDTSPKLIQALQQVSLTLSATKSKGTSANAHHANQVRRAANATVAHANTGANAKPEESLSLPVTSGGKCPQLAAGLPT